jgi:hypothetical protein
MPFTFAHPAAVMPLRRFRFLQTVPLIIGSLTPDVPYFFPERVGRWMSDSHSLYGTFFTDLPLGLALLLFTLLMREPLTALMSPRGRKVCLRSIERFDARPLHWPIAVLSILVGVWTHLAWDSITHPTGWSTLHMKALNVPIWLFGWKIPLSHLLQYVSSIFGLLVLALWFRTLTARASVPAHPDLVAPPARWLLLILIATIAIVIGGVQALRVSHDATYYHIEYLLLTRVIAWFSALYFLAGTVVMFTQRAVPEPAG